MPKAGTNLYPIREDFRQLLLDLTVTYLLELPENPLAFAAEYFERITTSPIANRHHEDLETHDSFMEYTTRGRRKAVVGEAYNPAEDHEPPPDGFPKPDNEKEILKAACQKIFIFRTLEEAQWEDVINYALPRIVQANEEIIHEGEEGEHFYVIESGTYDVYKTFGNQERKVHSYVNSGCFGELALLYNEPRAATIRATTDGKLWVLSRQIFRKIVTQQAYKKRKTYEELITNVPILDSLRRHEILNLADSMTPKNYKNDEIIIKQGEDANGMYFIEKGEVRVSVMSKDGFEIEINRLHSGDYFGELALLTHKPRAASVYAVGQVKVAFLDVDTFERLLGPCREIMQRNIDNYKTQLIKIFGSLNQISDLR